MNTIRIYETDSHARRLQARVLSCEESENGWLVELDRTIFYPTGGGQPCDTGTLGGADVTETLLRGETVLHRCTAALPVGADVTGEIDWARRLDLMQQHSGEHLVSGLIHARFGYENVGFHLGADLVTIDFNGEVDEQALQELERAANEAVWADFAPHIWYPEPDELAHLPYRSKKALTGAVRLVQFGDIDLCACCGTHVSTTGQVGAIKILSAQSYKGGTRLAVVCGERAHQSIAAAWQDAAAVGTLLSSAPGRLLPAVQNLQTAEAALKQRLAAMQNALSEALAQAAVPGQPAVLHCDGADGDGLRRICLAVSARTNALTAVLASGGQGLAYALCLPGGDVRPVCKALNEAFGGRGGGKPGFCQGSLACTDFADVQNFLVNYHE